MKTEYTQGMNDNILRCFVDLRRNDADYSFVSTMLESDKQTLLSRINDLLDEQTDTWNFYSLENIDSGKRLELENNQLIDSEVLQNGKSNIFISEDQTLLICINMEDHLLIRAVCNYGQEQLGIKKVKEIAQILSRGSAYAKDERIGWLTAKPQFAGTGIQVTYFLHLPMLSMMQQIKAISAKINHEHRFLLRPQYPEDNNSAALYYLKNLFTAYGSSENLLQDIHNKLIELISKEENLRTKILKYTTRSVYSDQIYRAYGILKYARRLTQNEFFSYWSKLRLGANAGLLPLTLQAVDNLLSITTKSMLIKQSDGVVDEHAIHFNRADAVRAALNGGK